MKKTAFISGALAFALTPIGILFKLMHWHGAGVIITLGIALFSLVFVPSMAKYLYDKAK